MGVGSRSTCILLSCLWFRFDLPAQQPVTPSRRALGTVTILVALVGDNLVVKPVPLYSLTFRPVGTDSTLSTRTGLDGAASVSVHPGSYMLASASPAVLDGKRYTWSVPVAVLSGVVTHVELTNANATVDSTSTEVERTRQLAPEMSIYALVREGVFRVEAGLGHGSGFLVDSLGLVLTNAHVVAGDTLATVVLDSLTRVRAQVILRDNEEDLAVLRVSPAWIVGKPVLAFAHPELGQPLVAAGERLFAVGFPLHQEQTLTSGIASSVREGAIISDVNINHGNSGGPLFNLAGDVVGVNTFGDFSSQGGPGVSGSIVITRALPFLARSRSELNALGSPDTTRLPLLPSTRFSVTVLKAFADSTSPKRYSLFDDIDVGRFILQVTTPPIAYVRRKAFEADVGKDRKRREARSGLSEPERYSEMLDYRDWDQYVGDDRVPVVSFTVTPKLGETSGSVFRRLLLTGAGGKQTIRYRSDLRAVRLYRNGVQVSPIMGGVTPVKQYVNDMWVDLKDVASYGYYVFSPEVFAPDSVGTPPALFLHLDDLKNPTSPSCTQLSREIVATIWNDFEMFYRGLGVQAIVASDPRKRHSHVSGAMGDCPRPR